MYRQTLAPTPAASLAEAKLQIPEVAAYAPLVPDTFATSRAVAAHTLEGLLHSNEAMH